MRGFRATLLAFCVDISRITSTKSSLLRSNYELLVESSPKNLPTRFVPSRPSSAQILIQ